MSAVRVYHFRSAEHALDDIKKQRIKISGIGQLNEPFELWCVAQGAFKSDPQSSSSLPAGACTSAFLRSTYRSSSSRSMTRRFPNTKDGIVFSLSSVSTCQIVALRYRAAS